MFWIFWSSLAPLDNQYLFKQLLFYSTYVTSLAVEYGLDYRVPSAGEMVWGGGWCWGRYNAVMTI